MGAFQLTTLDGVCDPGFVSRIPEKPADPGRNRRRDRIPGRCFPDLDRHLACDPPNVCCGHMPSQG